jgi:hypothetical protein
LLASFQTLIYEYVQAEKINTFTVQNVLELKNEYFKLAKLLILDL